MVPIYRVIADGKDITDILVKESAMISIEDNAGHDSDSLSIECDLNAIEIPSTGAELEVSIGFKETSVTKMGLYVVDGVDVKLDSHMTITANAANFSKKSKIRKNSLKSERDKSWDKTTIGKIVDEIASRHGYTLVVSESLKPVIINHRDQLQESDINFLKNLAIDNGAVFKPVDGRLLFVEEHEGKTASKQSLPEILLTPEDLNPHPRITIKDRKKYDSAVASYHDKKLAKTINEGEPSYKFNRVFDSEVTARNAAKAKLAKLNTGQQELSASMVGNTDLFAEAPLAIFFRKEIASKWIIKTVRHSISSSGFSTSFTAEVNE